MKRKLTFLLTAMLLLSGMSLWAQTYTWESTDFSNLTSSDVFVIVGNNGSNYAMTNNNGTSNAPAVSSVSVSGNNLTGDIAENIQWTISGNATDGYTFYPNGSTTTWLYCTNSNNGVRVGTNTNNTFHIDAASGYLVHNGTSRYIGIYNSQDWRCYTSNTGNIINQTFTFYKRVSGGTSQNPYITADNVEIEYDATSGSIAYTVQNPVSGGVLTANTTSDWLSLGTVGTTVPFTCTANELSAERSASVTLTYTYNTNQTVTKNVTVTQSGNPNVLNNISDITATGTYVVQGTIVAKSSRGFIVGDGTGYVYYYNQNYSQSNYNIGDMVKLSGSVITYGGVYEFNNTATVTAASTSNYEEEEPTVIDGAAMDSRVASTTPAQLSDYVQYVGTLSISGTHYNITNIDGATTAQGSISYPLDTDFTSLDGQEVTVKGYFVGISSSTYYNTMLGSIEANEVIEPSINVSVTELSGFQYTYNAGPSASQSFTMSGVDLTTDATLTAPEHYEISLSSDSDYSESLTISPVNGVIDETVIYVRMQAGLEEGSYSGDITLTCGTLNATVVLSGSVLEDLSPVLMSTPTSLSGMTYAIETGGPSEITYFELSGNRLIGPAQVYPSESFEVSTMPEPHYHPENPANVFSQGIFHDIKIYVRMKAGLEVGTYNEQLYAVSEDADTIFINVSGTVTSDTPPTPPTPGDGSYVRINDINSLTDGSYVVFAARFDENATDYYAMSNASSGKPTGVLFTSATSEGNEILPASIADEENSYYWIVGITANGYTFTNAAGELIGYSSGTNFATGGDNTEWAIELSTSGDAAMVPGYTGFVVGNVNNNIRAFALNSNYNFGPYHTQNMNGSGYNFYLDLFVKAEGSVPPTPTVAAPTFTPAAGTYYEVQTVSITCATEDATIYYSTNSENGPWTSYSEAITVAESMTIWAYAEKEGYNDSPVASASYTIQSGSGAVTIFNQDWEGEMNGWTFFDVEGAATWSIAQTSGNHYAKINAYNQGANIDWCISPAFNLDAYNNPTLSFRTAKNYTGNDIEVFISNNYESGNPTNAIWTSLTCALSTGSWNWVESGDIDLSSFSGTNCHIGFMYTSTENEAAGWEIDDILLVGQTSEPIVNVTPLVLTGFNYIEGDGPSDEQSFTVSGLNLSGNITISEAADYEISLGSGNDFVAQASLTLTPDGGNLEETTVYVRLKAGLTVGNYNDEDITITCADVDDLEVTCNGSVSEQPVPGGDYVRISDAGTLVAGNQVILAARYNETINAYLALANTPTSGKLATTEFTSAMSGTDEIIPASILADEDSYYWTVGVTEDGYTFTNANGDMISYGNSGTNFTMNGEKSVWTIASGTSSPESMVPDYFGFNIVNAITDTRAFALRTTDTESIVKAYATSNMNSSEYNFFLDIFMQGEGGVPPTPTVAAPTFTPAAGTYFETQDVTISCATAGATIYYSLDSETGPWNEYEEAVTIDESMIIWAYAEKEGYNDSPVVSAEYIIMNDLTIIFNQDWEGDWNGWTQVSLEGDEVWNIAEHSGNHYAYMNGYSGGAAHANEDWLISPAFDLDSYSDVVLTFSTARNYNGPDIEVLFSNDYDGQDPTTATWQELECELSTGSWNWVESGEIDLSEFSGTNCHIAYKYICTDDEAAGWEIDDIMLVAGGSNTDPFLIATPNALSGLNHIIGQGPSNVQTFTLSGGNFLPLPGGGYGGVWLTLSDFHVFEMSLDGEEFTGGSLYIELDETLTLEPTTVYVRLWGDEIGQYSETISIEEPSGVSITVSLSGAVLSEDEPMMLAMMPLYIQGNNGSNNNRVPVAAPVQLVNLEPNTTYRYTNQFVDSNDGPETAGAGNVIFADPDGFYRSTSPSLATEGGYGEFTTDDEGYAFIWLVNEPTANARFTPGNQVYLRVRLNDGNDGTTAASIFTSEDYATVINFGTENEATQGTAFYAKSNESAMSFAMLYASYENVRPVYTTSIEAVGVDYAGINQYANFYKDEVAGKDGWFGGILPNVNELGINYIVTSSMDAQTVHEYSSENGQWAPEANTVNPTNGLGEPIFIDLTDNGVEEEVASNVKIWNSDNEFVIENSDNAHYMMTVYNILGQPMMQQQINAGSTERISHSLAAGVYVISLQNTQSIVSVKVIVR